MKYLVILALLFSVGLAQAKSKEVEACEGTCVQVMSCAKSGTNLIMRLIRLIKHSPCCNTKVVIERAVHPCFYSLPSNVGANTLFRDTCLFNHGKSKVIFMVRDPRDTSVAWRSWMTEEITSLRDKAYEVLLHNRVRMNHLGDLSQMWHDASDDEKLSILISGTLPEPFSLYYDDLKWYVFFYHQGYFNRPDALLVHFEDLVGPKGGGDKKRQLQAIYKTADFLGVSLTQEAAEEIGEELFGHTKTFRKGQIGRWREAYNAEHKRLFKEFVGESLIILGYEKDSNW